MPKNLLSEFSSSGFAPAVIEVLELATAIPFAAPKQPPRGVIGKLELPECDKRFGAMATPWWKEGNQASTFLDLCENEMGLYLMSKSHEKVLSDLTRLFDNEEFKKSIFASLPGSLFPYRHWIVDDLAMIATKRAVAGRQDTLLERHFHSYASGGFPFTYTIEELDGIPVLWAWYNR